MRVLVLDPGERVGWATAEVELVPVKLQRNDAVDPRPIPQVVCEDGVIPRAGRGPSHTTEARLKVTGHGISYLKDTAMAVDRALSKGKYDVVVYENWKLTAKGARVSVGSEMESSQFIGMIRLSCWKYGVKIVKQPPSMQTPNGTGERALKCGHPSAPAVQAIIDKLPKSHDESHDRSALLHLWGWFFKEYV